MIKTLGVIYGMVFGIFSFILDRWSIIGGAIGLGLFSLAFGIPYTVNILPLAFAAASFILGAILMSSFVSIAALIYNKATKIKREENTNAAFNLYPHNPMYAGLVSSFLYNHQVERSPIATAIKDGMNQTNKIHHLYGPNNYSHTLDLELITKPSDIDSKATKIIRFFRGG